MALVKGSVDRLWYTPEFQAPLEALWRGDLWPEGYKHIVALCIYTQLTDWLLELFKIDATLSYSDAKALRQEELKAKATQPTGGYLKFENLDLLYLLLCQKLERSNIAKRLEEETKERKG